MVICVLRVSLIIVSPSACIFACQSSDTWDIRDILDFNDSGSLSKLTFGDGESGYIKKDECTGDSFEVGEAVVYEGKQCIVRKAVDSNGKLKVKFSVTVEVGMTEADFSGAKMGQSGAIILVAWLEHKVQHMTPTDYC
jgi:hypothetical protein